MMDLFLGVAKNLMTQGIEVDPDLMIKGFKDELSGKKLLIPDRELRRMMTMVQVELKRGQAQASLAAGGGQPEKGGGLPGREQDQRRCGDPAQWATIQDSQDGRRPEADGGRYGGVSLPGHFHQRNGVRQLLSPRETRNLQGYRGHPRMERGLEAHAGRVQVAALYPPPARLRVAGKRS